MAITPEMLQKLKGKAPMDPESMGGRPPMPGKAPEGSPEEEASESPEEAMQEGDAGAADPAAMEMLKRIPDDVLKAELDRRMAEMADGDADDNADAYFKEGEDDMA